MPETPKIPVTPTTAERLTKLEAEMVTIKMQYKAALNSLTVMAENIDRLANATQWQSDRINSLDATYREMLLQQALQLSIDFDVDAQQPTPDDVRQVDEWKLGIHDERMAP